MDIKRRQKKNQLLNDIRDSENFIDRSRKSIKNIRNSNMDSNYILNQITKLRECIKEKEEHVEILNQKVKKINTGELDSAIDEEYKVFKKNLESRKKERSRKLEEEKVTDTENKNKSKNFWKNTINGARANRRSERDVRGGYRHFLRACNSFPDHLKKNLKKMSHNKGYIWRGVHFYGELPPIPGPCVLFEKQHGVLVIHEYGENHSYYKKYHKKGKDKKILIENNRR